MPTLHDESLDGVLPGDEIPKVAPFVEVGATGLRRNAGIINEEFLPQLKGRKAVQVYREMSDNDAVIGALLFAISCLMRQIDWRVEPASQSSEDKKAAEFVEQCMEDMSMTWDETINEILTCLVFGWSWHEIVYKRRCGPWEKDGRRMSKYTDNMIGWRKIPIRAQETLTRWIFGPHGEIMAMVQMAPPDYSTKIIPIEKSLLFRVQSSKGNPEGRSLLRTAYRSWFMKKRLEEIEGIGAERDLAGLPMARVPDDYFAAPKGSEKNQMLEAFKQMVKAVRRNEQEGILVPRKWDTETKQDLFDFELLGSGGSRQFDINTIIERYETRMLMTVLADFILVGHQGTGSYSLHTDKTGLFRASMNSITESVADVFNRYAIPRLFEVNGWKPKELPQMVPGDIDPPDLAQLSAFISQLATAGLQWFPDPELEKFLRQTARMPKLDETAEAVKEAEARQAAIMRLAEQRVQMVQLSQTAEQGALGIEQQKQQMEIEGRQANEQMNPEVQAATDTQTVQSGELDLAAKVQQMQHKDEEHDLKLQALKAQMEAKTKGEDPRFAQQKLKQGDDLHKEKIGQMRDQRKAGQQVSAEKLKQMRLKPKAAPAKAKGEAVIDDTKIVTFNGSYRTREPVEALLKRAREDGPIIEVNAYNFHGNVWVNFATVVALEVIE